MSSDGSTDGTFGVSHLSSMPITLTYGLVLVLVLVILVAMRVLFGSITVSGGAR